MIKGQSSEKWGARGSYSWNTQGKILGTQKARHYLKGVLSWSMAFYRFMPKFLAKFEIFTLQCLQHCTVVLNGPNTDVKLLCTPLFCNIRVMNGNITNFCFWNISALFLDPEKVGTKNGKQWGKNLIKTGKRNGEITFLH